MPWMLDPRHGGDAVTRRILHDDEVDDGFDYGRLSWPVGIIEIVGVEEVARESGYWRGGVCSQSHSSSFLSHVQ